MSVQGSGSATYLDLRGLTELKAQHSVGEEKRIRDAASQFEALFVEMMLKSMREASPRSELTGSNAEELYRDMFDKELSVQLAKRGTLGLADQMTKSILASRGASMQPAIGGAGGFPVDAKQATAYPLDRGSGAGYGAEKKGFDLKPTKTLE